MDLNTYLSFSGKNLLFSTAIIFVTFFLGWILYNSLVLKKIKLKDALFEKDNLAAWVEFIGAFVFPTLYLAGKAVQGSVSEEWTVDLLYCIIYAVIYVILFTILRLASGAFVGTMSPSDESGKICLNNEIYGQHNISAALFSTTLSIIFVNIVSFIDIGPEYIATSLLRMAVILVFTLVAFAVYALLLRKKTALLKEIFVDNNIAAGAAIAGFIFAVETILSNMVILQKEFDFVELAIFSFIGLAIMGILSFVFKWVIEKIIKVNIWSEVYEQNNIGAAIGQIALYISIANVIVNYLK